MAEQDEKIFKWVPPWGWPGLMLAKSAQRKRWCLFLWLHTNETYDGLHHTFTWLAQFRLWWPPVLLLRGWITWDS